MDVWMNDTVYLNVVQLAGILTYFLLMIFVVRPSHMFVTRCCVLSLLCCIVRFICFSNTYDRIII